MHQIYPFAIDKKICSPNKIFFKQLFFLCSLIYRSNNVHTRNTAQNVVISWFCYLPVNYTNYTCLGTSRHLNNDDSPRQVTKSTISIARVTLFLFITPKKYLYYYYIFSNHMRQHFPRWLMQQNPSRASPVIQHSSTARIH